MNFRSIAQLDELLLAGLGKVPREVDLVVGVPRSGMLPASMLALHRNLALTDVSGLVEGRLMDIGVSRVARGRIRHVSEAKCIFVIDDSCHSGNQMRIIRNRVLESGIRAKVIYAAVFVTPEASALIDVFFEICPLPRMFEWNCLHHPALKFACLDIDGVLCRDPTAEQNDDGDNYGAFLADAEPFHIPSVPVGWLVTSRLEKYRAQTERWLRRQGVNYAELIMLNMSSAIERRRARCHGRFKGEIYRSLAANIFIESDPAQASEIANISAKPVLCVCDNSVYLPSTVASIGYATRKLPVYTASVGWRVLKRVRKLLDV